MKQLIIFFFLVSIQIVLSELSLFTSGDDNDYEDPKLCQNGDGPIGCSADCTSRQICMNGEVYDVKCPRSALLNLPTVCNVATDKCELKAKCYASDKEFICPGRGTYPHLFNCHKLFMCEKRGDEGREAICGKNKKYNPATGECVLVNLCHNFSPVFGLCYGKSGKIIAHPQNKKYYIYCNDVNPVLGSCYQGHVFNIDTLKCEFKCTKSGSFIDEENKNCFYKCKWTGIFNKYKSQHECCPVGEVYNEKLQLCGPDVTRKA